MEAANVSIRLEMNTYAETTIRLLLDTDKVTQKQLLKHIQNVGACCGRVCVLAGVVVQQQGAWRRPTSLNFDNPVFPSVERLTPTAENVFYDLDFFRQHKKWSIWFILSKTRLSKKAFFDKFFPTAYEPKYIKAYIRRWHASLFHNFIT